MSVRAVPYGDGGVARSSVLRTKLPAIAEYSVAGRRLVVCDRRGELTELRLVVPAAGSRRGRTAWMEILAEAIRQGLPARLDGRAALTVEVRPDRVVISAKTLRRDAQDVLRGVVSALTARDAPGRDAFAAACAIVAHRWAAAATSPMSVARHRFLTMVHGTCDPLAFEGQADPDGNYPRDAAEVLDDALDVGGTGIVVVGAEAPEVFLATVYDISERLPKPLAPPAATGRESQVSAAADVVRLRLKDSPQDLIRLGRTTVGRGHPDYPALQVGALAFGGYPLSRLTRVLREREGLSYAPRALLDPVGGTATFVMEMDVTAGTAEQAITLAKREHEQLGGRAEDLEIARRYAIGAMAISCSSRSGMASMLAGTVAASLPLSWLYGYGETIENVSDDQVAHAHATYCPASSWVGVIAGDDRRHR